MNLTSIVISIISSLIIILLALSFVPVLIWMERRVSGFSQDRLGPNRCNILGFRLGGLVQSLADVVKLVFKEDFVSSHIKHKGYFSIAPFILLFCCLAMFAVIPFADSIKIGSNTYLMQAIPIDLGVLWILAFAGLSIYGIIIGGYGSDNKYSILGALRGASQVISYELSMGLALISAIVIYGSINLNTIVHYQEGLILNFLPSWGIFLQPISAIIFFITMFAETNRAPFDLTEGESELVGGFHTEYSAMRFGVFFVGEYIAMVASSAFFVILFLGGYQIPWVDTQTLRDNISVVLIIIAILLPISTLFFSFWMLKSNRWSNPKDKRYLETSRLIKFFIATNILIVGVILFIIFGGFGITTTNVVTVLVQLIVFSVKVFIITFIYIWVRWTLLRIRFDQLQMFGWKVLLPISLANVVLTSLIVVI